MTTSVVRGGDVDVGGWAAELGGGTLVELRIGVEVAGGGWLEVGAAADLDVSGMGEVAGVSGEVSGPAEHSQYRPLATDRKQLPVELELILAE